MEGMWNLPVLHAVLHPNDRMEKSVSSAHVVASQFVRKRMLPHSLPAAQNPFPHYPIYHPQ